MEVEPLRSAVLVALVMMGMSLAACASDVAHQNFRTIMQGQVGKSVDNPYTTRNRYPDRQLSIRQLVNGNTEEEFKTGRGLRCRTFFEIDNQAHKVVGWRYEGSEQDCAIVP